MVDGQPAPVGDVGGVFFDVADGLAVINLFGAYAYTYDENRLDEFRELFTESPELVLQHDGHNLSGDIDAVMSLLLGKKRSRPKTTSGATRCTHTGFPAKAPARRPGTVMSRSSLSRMAVRPVPT